MKKEYISYPSADGITTINAAKWIPDGKPKAVLQIVHGMVEYIERYNDFARYLADHGYLVVAEDHIGHGKSVVSPEYYGYFGNDGAKWIIADIHHLREQMQNDFPDIPYMMLGHSMGSFLTRQYITEKDAAYAEGLAGVIIMGTGWKPAAKLVVGRILTKILGTKKKAKRTKLIEFLEFGPYLKHVDNPETSSDWLTKDKDIIKAYRKDPLCTFHFTPNGFYHLACITQKAQDISRIKKLPAGLPILFASGAEVPVGKWGEGVRKAFMVYKENTECIVDINLYLDDRHEILNETNRAEVYKDMLEFLDECI